MKAVLVSAAVSKQLTRLSRWIKTPACITRTLKKVLSYQKLANTKMEVFLKGCGLLKTLFDGLT